MTDICKNRLPNSTRRRNILLTLCSLFFAASIVAVAPILLINGAKKSLKKNNPEHALVLLNRASWFIVYSGQVEFQRARCFRRMGLTTEFSEAIKSAKDKGVSSEDIQREQTYFLAQAGQLRGIEPHIAEIFEKAGEDSDEACEAYTNGLLVNMRQQEALNVAEMWAKDYPNDARPECVKAQIYKSLNRPKRAEEALLRALELDPESDETAAMLGNHLIETRNLDRAEQIFRNLLAKGPMHDTACLALSRVQRLQGNIAASKKSLEAIENPKVFQNNELDLQTALLAVDERNFVVAEKLLTDLISVQPRLMEAQNALSVTLRGLGRQEQAVNQAKKVSDIEAKLSQINRLYDIVAASPGEPTPRLEIGKIELEVGDTKRGIAWLQSVLNLQPGNPDALKTLAAYYEQQALFKPEFDKLARHYRSRADGKQSETP